MANGIVCDQISDSWGKYLLDPWTTGDLLEDIIYFGIEDSIGLNDTNDYEFILAPGGLTIRRFMLCPYIVTNVYNQEM